MKRYLAKVKEIMGSFDKVTFTKVPREENSAVDALTRIATATEEEITTSDRPVQEFATPSIGRADQIAWIEKEQGDLEWGRDILSFLKTGKLPTENKLAQKIQI